MAAIGLSFDELQAEIERRMAAMDAAQEDADDLGPFADLMRMAALTAYQRAADLIVLNNERLARDLAAAGVRLPERDV
ncbi:MAG TPA: hypothetical protein VFI22_11655 [Thermomicrobiales bacterium]|nr:hypothetical protein [Thermomicrobiales bacterium]